MIGQWVGNYQITGVLGEGGMGTVYVARHRDIDRLVAIKILLPQFSDHQEVIARFFNEARAAGAVQHPGIVEVFDCGYDSRGQAYITMEYVAGETLEERRKRLGGVLSPREVIAIGQMAAEVLAAVHEKGIVHRDLKPDNIMMVPEGPTERVKILDFGLAKLQGELGTSSVKTKTGTFMGTPAYMAPEQCTGAKNVDGRADIYSLGCVLYKLVAGRPPFVFEDFGATVAAHLGTPPPPPSSLEPTVPARLERLILSLLEKKPEDRYQTMSQVAKALAATSADRTLPPIPDRPPPPRKEPPEQREMLPAAQVPPTHKIPMPPERSKWLLPLVLLISGLAIVLVVIAVAVSL